MRLSCPNCLTEYEVPDAAIAGRTRTLRCAQCGQQWIHGAVTPPAVPEALPEPPPAPPPVAVIQAPAEEWTPAPPPMPDLPTEHEVAAEAATLLAEKMQAETLPKPAPEPAFTWATPPAAPAGWPEFTSENASLAEPVEAARSFGVPADDAARADVQEAVAAEAAVTDQLEAPAMPLPEVAPESEPAPASLRLLTDEDFRFAARPPEAPDAAEPAEQDSFAALVSAARRKSLEYEPEPPPPPPPVRTSSKPLFFILLILFLLGMAVLERHLIVHLFPASAKLFQGLGLKQ